MTLIVEHLSTMNILKSYTKNEKIYIGGGFMNFNPNDDRYIYEIVSKNIKYFRLHNNSKYSSYGKMTQEKLAEKCDLSHSLISNIESSKVQQSFSIAVLYRISRVLEIDIREFFVKRDFNDNN